MKAELISIGTEILLGDIVNTNAQFLAKELALLGIDVYYQSVIGDNEERILKAFKEAFDRCDIIITTGGLGPTQDDLTKELGAKYFNKKMILHEPSLEWIKKYLDINNEEVLEANKNQAYFPEGSIILPNENGTAPGAIISENNKTLIILPGPPKEMKSMFSNHVTKYLSKLTKDIIKSKTLRIFGIGESLMAKKLDDIIKNSKNPTVAPYAKEYEVTLRITAKEKSEDKCDELIKNKVDQIKGIIGEYIYGEDEVSLEEVVAKLLCDKKLSISTAESCTGGMISSTLIEYPGISEIFKEGVVTYSNESKIKRLGVKEETLNKFGAVSEETAREMVIGIAEGLNTDIAISSTGIAGPGGGTKDKPVGLVYIGIYIKGNVKVEKLNLRGDREAVRKKATLSALNLLRKEIIRNY
ncbi:competence/damage-inducible protein A [Clostridium sp. Sa3CUN1]|uniref:Putative competence-damage inducible protein n=1 Tax=Clostridium gallinarum TaxID=2762246 RepID=A0ABR8Q7Y1_9CLOT|nr:competence/damage-inducible protein A [Clostridium gallinarum]MBD7916535.1 competence/damage-inducible protein A [Clostridium gallinarum]